MRTRKQLSVLLFLIAILVLCMLYTPARAQYRPDAYQCMAQAMYFEAGIEQREGMRAVGWVVLNRMAHPKFPATICQVVHQGGERRGCQFSYWCDGKSDTPRNWRVWQEARQMAKDVLTGLTVDPTGGALFFHSTILDSVPWHAERERTIQIGRHIYYR